MYDTRWLLLTLSVSCSLLGQTLRAERDLHEFETLLLSEEFRSEGACFADIDGDGNQDIVSGPLWYEGPEFRVRHAYAPGEALSIQGYSKHFFSFAHDVNEDGRPDILAIPMPGDPAWWFENPGGSTHTVHWRAHLALDEVSGESPDLTDLTGDGRPELVCIRKGAFGYATPSATSPWKWTPVTETRGYGRFTHGQGVGDVDGDGRADLLETNGWWQQTQKRGEIFRFHAQRFAESGGAQMFAYDFDGDGDNDVLSTQNAHAWGLAWFEQHQVDGERTFTRHDILTQSPADNELGLVISQMHAVALVDVDGDGVRDILTGKRFYAHGGRDPGAFQQSVLYWFRTVRHQSGVEFEPRLIHERSGVGTQLTTGDVDGDGEIDVLIGNKLGTFLHRHVVSTVSDEEWHARTRQHPVHTAGTDVFNQHVCPTEPLSPRAEQSRFVLPEGFRIQLVASEPDIAKPMNLAIDADGRVWVSSSVEYPWAAPTDRPGRDKIHVISDTDADGLPETVSTFADELNIPIGLYPFEDGVICYSIPSIWRLRDTDGDGRADQREVLYGPMGHERDTHGMCNAFTRGLDGWLYACHGFNNESVVAGHDGHEIRMHSGNVFRMRVDGSRVELFSHGQVNPFGMVQDRFGDWFTADCHTKPVSLLIEGGYHESFGKPHDGLGFVPNVLEHLHGSTAIGGIALGERTRFPEVYRDSTFGGNVMTARVNRNTLIRRGGTVQAREEPDFLIANDPWFRPVDLQVAPDGSLYIADFYNRIIGHYEVPLEHPGRDRERGRVWRVVYEGSTRRRDRDLDPARFAGWSGNETRRSRSANSERDSDLVHRLWQLHRDDELDGATLTAALEHDSALVRLHAFRILGETTKLDTADLSKRCLRGFEDRDGLVRRAAVLAAAKHPADGTLLPLVALSRATDAADVHLRYSIRRALTKHLRDERRFALLEKAPLSPEDRELIAGLSFAIRSAEACEFVLENLELLTEVERVASDDRWLADLLELTARFASTESIADIVRVTRARFAEDDALQRKLLESLHAGFEQRGITTPAQVRSWALNLAQALLEPDLRSLRDGEALAPLIGWTALGLDGSAARGKTWNLSTKRDATDGRKSNRLWSSFPHGEQRTGVYRSDSFDVSESLSFWMCGHDGYPEVDYQNRNVLRLIDARTHATLATFRPPRHDTAHRFEWSVPGRGSRSVYVELVDGDDAGAFAWLAAGRFSVAGLNPSPLGERRQQAARLVARFRLDEERAALEQILRGTLSDATTAIELARAIASFDGSARKRATAEVFALAGMGGPTLQLAQKALHTASGAEQVDTALDSAMASANANGQLRLAEILASDRAGARSLLRLVESGRAGARLLTRDSVEALLRASLPAEVLPRVEGLTSDLPDDDAELAELIASRKVHYLQAKGDALAGSKLFESECKACHQVAGSGNRLAPNLDGIGARGLDRLLEDILDPNRNVDVAFRASVLVLANGQVHTGLVRREEGAQLVFADAKGVEQSVALGDIVQREASTRSLMPTNFGEQLSAEQLSDLLAWLLTLR